MAAARQVAAANAEETPAEEKQVYCWACRALVVVPSLPSGKLSPIFKCGWCGALNPRSFPTGDKARRLSSPGQSDGASASRGATFSQWLDRVEDQLSRLFCTCPDKCFTYVGYIIICFVSCLIVSIGVFGTFPVLYEMCPNNTVFAVNAAIAIFFEYVILHNYYLAVRTPAGSVEQFYDIMVAPPPRHSFDDFTYCTKCEKPKPPGAHHCSICKTCVVDMDHHCPFVANCVGRGNMRPFLLFLFWVTVAMLYTIPTLILAIFVQRQTIRQAFYIPRRFHRRQPSVMMYLDPTSLLLSLSRMPSGVLAAIMLLVVTSVVLLMVGMLCCRHWSLAASGETYIGSLKGEVVSTGGWYQNLQHVFGQHHPLLWVLPNWKSRTPAAQKTAKGA